MMKKTKKFTTDALKKVVSDEYKIGKLSVKGFAVEIDLKFRPTKIEEMGRGFLGTFFYFVKSKIDVNAGDLINYFIIKYFSSVGKEIADEIEIQLLSQEDRSDEHLFSVAALCDLEMMRHLIDTGMFTEILVALPKEEIDKIYKIHVKASEKLDEALLKDVTDKESVVE